LTAGFDAGMRHYKLGSKIRTMEPGVAERPAPANEKRRPGYSAAQSFRDRI
jgi:hypothetical protein